VKNIITEYGGRIDATSEVGKGTRFLIRLPAAMSKWAIAEVVAPREQSSGGAGRILVVDDEPGIRDALKGILRRHEVVEAESGEQDLELWMHDDHQATAALSRGLLLRGT